MEMRTTLRHCGGYLLALLIFYGCSGALGKEVAPIQPAPVQPAFETHEVVIGAGKHQILLTGFLLGGEFAEVAAVSVAEDGTRHLQIYGFSDGNWGEKVDVPLRREVLFVDVAPIGGRDRLITYEKGQLNWFDPDAVAERPLLEITTTYNAPSDGRVPAVDITEDINRDGLIDLVVPDIDGFWIATQLEDGTFTAPIKLGPPDPFLDAVALDESRSYRETGITELTALWYRSRLHQMDYDRDGRNDLVFWNTDRFEVYRQDSLGGFSTVAETFTVDIPFDSDGAYSIAFGFEGENMFSLIFGFRENTKRRVLWTFEDMNGDGVADIVIHTLEGRSLGKQRSRYEVHFGTPTPAGITFAREVSMTIQPRGTAGGLLPWGYASQSFQDVDGDGKTDIFFKDIKTGLVGMSRAMFGNSIGIDLEFYRMGAGMYPDNPTARHKIRPDLDLFEAPGVLFPVVLLGDVNGDRRADLLVGESWGELHIFLGIPGPELFSQTPQKMALAMPQDERNARLVDLNRDDKEDLLVYYPSAAEAHRVTLLIAQ